MTAMSAGAFRPKQPAEGQSGHELIENIVDRGGWQAPEERERGKDLVKEFLAQVLGGEVPVKRDTTAMINQRIYELDRLVSAQLNEVLHHPSFQLLEAAWRGLVYLSRATAEFGSVKLRVLNVSGRELHRSLNESHMPFQELLEASQEPISLLVGNYSFGLHPEEQDFLSYLSRAAARAGVPFLTAAAPGMFCQDSFHEMHHWNRLADWFDQPLYAKWHSFRHRDVSRYAVLAMPRILLRKPYSRDHQVRKGAHFWPEENITGTTILWGNPVWALAAQLGRAFANGSWCADLASTEDGGLVLKLPSFEMRTDEGDFVRIGPTESKIGDALYTELCDAGFAPMCRDQTGKRAMVFEIPTTHRSEPLEDTFGEKLASPPTMLREVLAECRLSQYIQAMVRDKRALFETAGDCERYLNHWAAKYTVPDATSTSVRAALYPFVKADFKVVRESEALDGRFRVTGFVIVNGEGKPDTVVTISTPILLKRSASTHTEERLGPEETVPDSGGEVLKTTIASTGVDSISAVLDSLERLADLRKKEVLSESDFVEMKKLMLGQIRSMTAPEARHETAVQDQATEYEVPYAKLHSHIVDLIAAPHSKGEDAKTRSQTALAQMAEKGALEEGDSELLNELLDVVFPDTADNSPAKSRSEKPRLGLLQAVAAKIRQKETASPATRAIAETAEQSGVRAFQPDVRKFAGAKAAATKVWRKFVWPDVEGAFSGGAAAASVFPILAPVKLLLPISMFAAMGVVIGAGVRSGVAYGEASQPKAHSSV